jgi:hypothetical protein
MTLWGWAATLLVAFLAWVFLSNALWLEPEMLGGVAVIAYVLALWKGGRRNGPL